MWLTTDWLYKQQQQQLVHRKKNLNAFWAWFLFSILILFLYSYLWINLLMRRSIKWNVMQSDTEIEWNWCHSHQNALLLQPLLASHYRTHQIPNTCIRKNNKEFTHSLFFSLNNNYLWAFVPFKFWNQINKQKNGKQIQSEILVSQEGDCVIALHGCQTELQRLKMRQCTRNKTSFDISTWSLLIRIT